jgi:hypothetical protein
MKHPILTLLVLFSLLAVHATEPAAAEAADTNTGPTQQPSSGAATKTGSAVAVSGPRVREVIVVFKTHFDIGYTDMARNVVQTYRTTMIDQALDVVDQNRDLPASQQFVWTIPGWPMHRILDWPEQTPERRHRVLQAFKDGRFVVHALPFTMHMETLELEDLVRGFGFSTKVSAAAGLPLPRDAKMTDVPEHTWTTATILSHAGVKFMHIGCNPMSGAPQVPPLFWWQGPDGSRVLTMYSPHYGTGLFPPDDWPHRTWLALEHTYDNLGPPKPEEVKKILQQYADKMPGVKVRIGRLSDFGEAILAEKPDLPVVRADSPDTWIHGPMSDPAGMKIARNIRPLIAATECLNTELRAWNQPVADASASIAAAYEKSLMYIRSYLKEQDRTRAFEKRGLPENVPYRAASPRDFKLRFETSPSAITAVMESAAATNLPAITTRLILYRGQSYADLEITLHDKPLDSWPEAGWLCLPFKVDAPRFRLGRLGSIIDPANDIVPSSNRDLFALNTGLTLTDPQGNGVGLCPLDHPVVSLGRPGCWQSTKEEFQRKPVAFLNLFNNQWNTNFRLWNGGTWTSRVRIWAVDHAGDEAALITPSLEARYPLLAAAADTTTIPPHPLPPTREGLSVSRRGVLVTAFGADPDSKNKTILRLWELAGVSGKVTVKLPKGMKVSKMTPVNLRGEPTGKPERISFGRFSVNLNAFAPASFLLELR